MLLMRLEEDIDDHDRNISISKFKSLFIYINFNGFSVADYNNFSPQLQCLICSRWF